MGVRDGEKCDGVGFVNGIAEGHLARKLQSLKLEPVADVIRVLTRAIYARSNISCIGRLSHARNLRR